MTALAAPTREKLIKVMSLLGSDQLGERAAAALAADRLIRSAGIGWSDLIAPPPARREAPGHGHQDHDDDAGEDALRFLAGIVLVAPWPARFLADIRLLRRSGRGLSVRQREKLIEIAREHGWRGRGQ